MLVFLPGFTRVETSLGPDGAVAEGNILIEFGGSSPHGLLDRSLAYKVNVNI
jgi:hypothetical protein